jgi:hypothetical protein
MKATKQADGSEAEKMLKELKESGDLKENVKLSIHFHFVENGLYIEFDGKQVDTLDILMLLMQANREAIDVWAKEARSLDKTNETITELIELISKDPLTAYRQKQRYEKELNISKN